ncbi:hypothetical protein SAMN05216303_10113 [Rhodoferax sp. OV413]|uniref:hypothetical protein n=1 Tax=Rhodoferax sp. OV413 TaxID=1855285 RepID=UPI00087F828D|nr:hypothetical protein [Rhodoferax sp. OV413]SDN91572.1 hypothetical protein SAMN05216303_10113 [Rhodoferax sp. OV413]
MPHPADISTHTSARRSYMYFAAIALFAVTAATAQVSIDASGNYQDEVRACRSGHTPQSLATCLEEARNARTDKSRRSLSADTLLANAMARCEKLPPDDQTACRARMMGQGNSSGSVAGGGILREYNQVEVVPATP